MSLGDATGPVTGTWVEDAVGEALEQLVDNEQRRRTRRQLTIATKALQEVSR